MSPVVAIAPETPSKSAVRNVNIDAIGPQIQAALTAVKPEIVSATTQADSLAALLGAYYTALGGRIRKDAQAFIQVGSRHLTELFLAHQAPRVEDQSLPIADRWEYWGADDCARFYTACLKRTRPPILSGASWLDIGCAEFDWLAEMARLCPDMTVTGIDWRPTHRGIQGDVLTYDFPPASFDAIVSISAIEHVGLGHYANQGETVDPVAPDGDSEAITRALTWLKPGGYLFFDVPFAPDGYRVAGTSHREYDEAALYQRLIAEPLRRSGVRADVLSFTFGTTTGAVIDQPRRPGNPFYYVGVWLRRLE